MKFDLEDRTIKFSKNVIHVCQKMSMDAINARIVNQLIGSSGSVGANYREANDALGKKDFIQRMRITRREAKEAHYWVELLLEANKSAEKEIVPLRKEALELKRIFSTIINNAK